VVIPACGSGLVLVNDPIIIVLDQKNRCGTYSFRVVGENLLQSFLHPAEILLILVSELKITIGPEGADCSLHAMLVEESTAALTEKKYRDQQGLKYSGGGPSSRSISDSTHHDLQFRSSGIPEPR
jgi:hypothetical protein